MNMFRYYMSLANKTKDPQEKKLHLENANRHRKRKALKKRQRAESLEAVETSTPLEDTKEESPKVEKRTRKKTSKKKESDNE